MTKNALSFRYFNHMVLNCCDVSCLCFVFVGSAKPIVWNILIYMIYEGEFTTLNGLDLGWGMIVMQLIPSVSPERTEFGP